MNKSGKPRKVSLGGSRKGKRLGRDGSSCHVTGTLSSFLNTLMLKWIKKKKCSCLNIFNSHLKDPFVMPLGSGDVI